MWTPEHRRAADRHGLRYPSDLSNAEWALVEPMIPPEKNESVVVPDTFTIEHTRPRE
jgi:hypothetical protein